MARKARVIHTNVVNHVFNRRNERQQLFASPTAFDRFVALLEEGKKKYSVKFDAYCVMDTHWHMALRTVEDPMAISNYLHWISTTHAVRFRCQSQTRGDGHVYQDRFKSREVTGLIHYFTLIRYIERNPLTGGLVQRAEHWPWSSLSERLSGRRRLLDDDGTALPADWLTIVNMPDFASALPILSPHIADAVTTRCDGTWD